MAHTHEYDCIVCGAHFDSMQELDRHNRREHVPPQSEMYNADVATRADSAPRPDADRE
jgi:hypothetical protein